MDMVVSSMDAYRKQNSPEHFLPLLISVGTSISTAYYCSRPTCDFSHMGFFSNRHPWLADNNQVYISYVVGNGMAYKMDKMYWGEKKKTHYK